MSNSQELNSFFIPERYPSYNAPISNAHIGFQPATTSFQGQNSISAKPQPPIRADTGSNPDLSHVIDFLVEAAQEAAREAAQEAAKDAAKKAVKGETEVITAALEAALEAKLESFKLEMDANIDAEIEKIKEIIRKDNSSLTQNLNGTLSGLHVAIKDEVTKAL